MTVALNTIWEDKTITGPREASMDIELTLSAATVRMLIQKARAATNAIDDSFEGGHEHEVEFDAETLSDGHHHDGLAEEESDDKSKEELRDLIDDLNVDEAAELVAIAWIGRGDFEADDLAQAVEEARERAMGSTAKYLLGMLLLPDYLEAGLDSLNL